MIALDERIGLKHGAGGPAMRRLIADVLLDPASAVAATLDDGAAIPLGGRWLIVTTDSHVIKPVVFPGGDIGRLAVCGTVNDLAVMGATAPLGVTCAIVVEEGFSVEALRGLVASMRHAAAEAGTSIVTGDTKVMPRGEIDGIVINTAGVALADRVVTDAALRPGDVLIVSGTLGDHGVAVMAARHHLELGEDTRSDVAPLNGLVAAALAAGGDGVVAMKDPTRGGLASALGEMAAKSGVGLLLDERSVPVRAGVRAAADLLGIDPLFIANEGKVVMGVTAAASEPVLAALRAHPLGRDAAIVGRAVADMPGAIVVDTGFGRRLVTEPDGELLPRIC